MTINLLQLDHGKESITPMFQSNKEKEQMAYLIGLEEACPGCTIFIHRLSGPGHYFCTVPCAHARLAEDPDHPPRYCGCYDCIDQRTFTRTYTAWVIIPNMQEMMRGVAMPSALSGSSDALGR